MAEENLPLEIFNLIFFFIGKTGLIAFITVFCTLVAANIQLLLAQVSTKITAKGDSLERRKELLQSDEGSRFCISASLRLLLNDLWYLRLCPCSGTLHLEFFTVHLECFCFFHLRISALDAALQVLQKAN